MKHQKHAKITRPNFGEFGRNEWAIIGTPCGNIQQLAYSLTNILQKKYKVAYVDADHKSGDEETIDSPTLAQGGSMEYTDKINFHQFNLHANLDTFQFRQYFNEQDIVLVNGNHFKAKHQIVVIDAKKEKSLEKKLDRLTDVQLILLEGDATEVYPFLKKAIKNIDAIPLLHISQKEKIADFIFQKMNESKPVLNGLVLAGGKSVRMGKDKGAIEYHGKPQREYMADLLNEICEKTYLSVRPNQGVDSDYLLLEDKYLGLGPFGAILTAFQTDPNSAWLVVACDLPFLDQKALEFLKENRATSKIATAFHNPETDFPDPLITIWEPKSYSILLNFLAQGYSCPRKALINSDIHTLNYDAKILMNVNDSATFDQIIQEFQRP